VKFLHMWTNGKAECLKSNASFPQNHNLWTVYVYIQQKPLCMDWHQWLLHLCNLGEEPQKIDHHLNRLLQLFYLSSPYSPYTHSNVHCLKCSNVQLFYHHCWWAAAMFHGKCDESFGHYCCLILVSCQKYSTKFKIVNR